eukprot:49039_1
MANRKKKHDDLSPYSSPEQAKSNLHSPLLKKSKKSRQPKSPIELCNELIGTFDKDEEVSHSDKDIVHLVIVTKNISFLSQLFVQPFRFWKDKTLYLQFENNQWRVDQHYKTTYHFNCCVAQCKNFVALEKNVNEICIVDLSPDKCDHPPTLKVADFGKIKAKDQIFHNAQYMKARAAYEEYALQHPIETIYYFHGFEEIKSTIYRKILSNKWRPPQPKDRKDFTTIMNESIIRWNFWGYHKRLNMIIHSGNEQKENSETKTEEKESFEAEQKNAQLFESDKMIKYKENQNAIDILLQENKQILSDITMSIIPSEYEMMYYQGNDGTDDFQLFFNKFLLKLVLLAVEWLIDGTFQICPSFGLAALKKKNAYVQLIHIEYRVPAENDERVDETINVINLLCKNKQRKLYDRAFEYLYKRAFKLGCDFAYKPIDFVRRASMDYEHGLRASASKKLYIDKQDGCLSHFSICIYRNFISKGLKPALEEKQFMYAYYMCKAVSLLPRHQMPDGLKICIEELQRSCPWEFENQNKEVIDYILSEWRDKWGYDAWCFHRMKNRTQAKIENRHMGWHGRFGTHPLIWEFVEELQVTDALETIKAQQLYIHGQTRMKNPDERTKEVELKSLWDMLECGSMDIKTFLKCGSAALKNRFETLEKIMDKFYAQSENDIQSTD